MLKKKKTYWNEVVRQAEQLSQSLSEAAAFLFEDPTGR